MKVGGTFREFLSTEKLSPDSHFAVGSRVELQKSTQWSRPQGRPQSGFSIVVVLIAILLFSNTTHVILVIQSGFSIVVLTTHVILQ